MGKGKNKSKKVVQRKPEDLLRELSPYCPKCDMDIGPSESNLMAVVYCPTCGADLVQPSLCQICGNPMNADAKFCTGCGNTAIRSK